VEQGISANEVVAASAKQDQDMQRSKQEAHEANEVFYTEGSEELKAARIWIMNYSLPKSRGRVRETKRKQLELSEYIARKESKIKETEKREKAQAGGALVVEEEDTRMDEESRVEQEHNTYIDRAGKYRNMDLACSQVGDVRPISGCHFSPDAQTLATCSWSGLAKIWSVPDCTEKFTLFGHSERLTDVKFHPSFKSAAMGSTEGDTVACATASVDKTVKLWNGNSFKEMHTLQGHAARVCRINFHPSGRFLGTTSFDKTWRLWDLETQQELLCQEGHARQIYSIAFQPDGALVASAGLDALCRIWDLRTGRSIMALQGHVKQVLALDFSPCGIKVATGSDDNTIRLWDLRRRKAYYTLPAHPKMVSSLRYSDCGDFLFSGSYDRSAKVWNLRNHTSIKTLAGHDEKVMCVDVAPGGHYIASASYDRTFKLWAPGTAF